jgi:hypothetical protein
LDDRLDGRGDVVVFTVADRGADRFVVADAARGDFLFEVAFTGDVAEEIGVQGRPMNAMVMRAGVYFGSKSSCRTLNWGYLNSPSGTGRFKRFESSSEPRPEAIPDHSNLVFVTPSWWTADNFGDGAFPKHWSAAPSLSVNGAGEESDPVDGSNSISGRSKYGCRSSRSVSSGKGWMCE